MNKVLIVYHYIAHYRKPIFHKLLTNMESDIEYFVAADNISNIKSISTINPTTDQFLSDKWISLNNRWFFNKLLWQENLIKTIFTNNYTDVIFLGNVYFISTWFAAIVCRLKGIKVHMWTHGLIKNEKFLKWLIRRSFYSLSDNLLLYGKNALNVLKDKGFSKSKTYVIYNSLDYDLQKKHFELLISDRDKLKNRVGFSNENHIILFTGRITNNRNLDSLIYLLKKIYTNDKKIRLLIIGDGPYMNSLISLSEELKVRHLINFYGACYDEDILSSLIMASDVLYFPGDIGLSAVHALSYGTPIVTHNNFEAHKPEFEAIIDGTNGSFVDISNEKVVIEKINYWLNQKIQSPVKMGEKCRINIDKYYNPHVQIKLINAIINDTYDKDH